MTSHKDGMSFWDVVSIGIGGMIGGGIFAVLGLSVELARGGAPVAFLVAGTVALITSYSYAKLSVKYPTQGGTVKFLNKAFGTGVFTGALNVLLWLSYIVMLSLYSYTFGSYASSFFDPSIRELMKHIFITGIVLAITFLNTMKSSIIGRTESVIVGLKVTILLLFILGGIWFVDTSRISPDNWADPFALIAGGMIIFLAYEGFELIANTSKDIKDVKKLPYAFYISVLFVIVIYVLVALVAVGNLPVSQIVQSRDYALAVAAEPFLGKLGFVLISIAAFLSTTSAINATLYGSARISYVIAKEGEFPRMRRKFWNKPIEGLIITSLITLVIANLFDLSSISVMGSSGFLVIFMAVNLANVVLHKKTRSNPWVSLMGGVLCFAALMILIWQSINISPSDILVFVFLIGLSFMIEVGYRAVTGRRITLKREA